MQENHQVLSLIVDGKAIEISPELYDWLCCDADERKISIEQACQEELEARRELERLTPSIKQLREMTGRSGAPAYLANEAAGDCPF